MTDHLETIRHLQLKLAEREEQHGRAEKVQTALYEIADAASATTNMQAFYGRLHEIIGTLMYAGSCFVALYDDQTDMLTWPYWVDAAGDPYPNPAPLAGMRNFTAYAIRNRKVLHGSRDLLGILDDGQADRAEVGTLGADGIIAPLLIENWVLGVLCVQSYEADKVYSEQDVQVLTFVAQHIATALTRARAIEETLQRNNELAILNSVGEAMSKTLDVKTVTRIVGDKVLDIFKCEIASIDLLDRQTDLFHVLYMFDKGEGGYVDYYQPYPFGSSLSSLIVTSRQPILLGTAREQTARGGYIAPEAMEIGSGVIAESYMAVPIIAGDQVLGVVSVGNYRPNAFTENDQRLLQTLSSSMGIAIQNARLFEAEQQRVAELQIINSIQQGLGSKLELQGIIDLVGDRLREVLHSDEIGIRLYDEQADLMHYPYEFEHGERLTIPPRKPSSLFQELQKTQLPVFGPTAALGEKYDFSTLPGTEASKAIASVPIIAGSRVIGTIGIEDYKREDAFNESNIRLMQTIAASMGAALENARLFDETQRLFKAEQQRAAELQIINSIQRGLGSKLELQGIIDLVGDRLREVLHSDEIGIRLYDEQADLMHYPYEFEHGERLTVPPMEPTLIFREMQETQLPVFGPTAGMHEKYGRHIVPGTEVSKAYATVPIIAGSRVIGSIAIEDYGREDAFNESNIRLMQTIAASMGAALENARLFDETQRLFRAEQQRAAELAIINSVQEGLASKLDFNAIIDLVGDKVRETFKSDTTYIFLYDRPNNRILRPYYVERGFRHQLDPLPLGVGLTSIIIQSRQPLLLSTTAEAEAFQVGQTEIASPAEEKDLNETYLGVPILAGNQVIGVVSIQSYEQHAYNDSDVRVLQTLANSMGVALENARLFDEVQKNNREISEALEQQTATADILRVMAASPADAQPVMDAIVEHAVRLCDGVFGALYRTDGSIVDEVAVRNLTPQGMELHGQAYPRPLTRDSSLSSRTILDGVVYHIPDIQNDPGMPELTRQYSRANDMNSLLFTPMLKDGKAIGAIAVGRRVVGPFDDKQIAMLKTFADQGAIAIENVRLFNETTRLLAETEQRAAELAIINSVQEGLASKLDMQAIYDLVGDKIREVFDAQVVLITLYDHHARMSRSPYIVEKGQRYELATRPFSAMAEHLIKTRQPVFLNERATEKLAALGTPTVPGTEAPKSVLFVPLIVGDEVKGSISLQNVDRENAFSDSDLRLLTTLANSMSVALENARLFDEVQNNNREISEALERQTATGNILRVMASSPGDIQPVLKAVAEHAAHLCEANDVQIYRVDGNDLRQMTHFGPLPALQDGEALPLVPGLVTGRAVLEQRTIHIEDMLQLSAAEYPESAALQARLGHRTAISTPLVREGKATGAIVVRRNEARPFSEKQIALLATFADQAAIAIENVRLFNETKRLLAETEQRAAELAIINSVQQGLASKLDMQAIYELVGEKIRETFGVDTVGIMTYDVSSGMLTDRYAFEKGDRTLLPESVELFGYRKHVVETRASMLINRDMERLSKEYGNLVLYGASAKSCIFVPMLARHQVTGIITLQNLDREDAYTEADVRLLETLASSMSVALENARLFDETQRLLKETEQRAAELSVINSVQQGLASKLDMQAIYDLVGDRIRDIFGTQVVYIAIRSADNSRKVDFPYYLDRGKRLRVEHVMLGEGITSRVIESRRPLRAGSMQEQLALGGIYDDEEQSQSYLGVPIFVRDAVIGVASVQSYKSEAFGEADERLLSTLAASMGVALENARLFDETQRLLKETEQRNAELAVINSVQSALAAKLDIQSIYDSVGDKVSEIFPGKDVGIRIYDPATNMILFPYNMEAGERISIDPRPRIDSGISNHVLSTRQPLLINENADAESAKYGSYTIPGTQSEKSALYVPLTVGDQSKGLLTLLDLNEEHSFTDSDVRLLTTVANSMSVALENARLFDETQRLLKETEQRAAELAIINSVQDGLSSKLEMQAIYDLVGAKISEIFDAQVVTINSYDFAGRQKLYHYSVEKGQRIPFLSRPMNSFDDFFVTSGEAYLVQQDAERINRERFPDVTAAWGELPRSFLCAPLFRDKRVVGYVSLQNMDRENAFTESDVRLLRTLANSMSVALENARLFDETERLLKETEQRAAELAIINSVQEGLASKLDFQAIIDLIGDKIRELFHSDNMSIRLYDRRTDLLSYPYMVDAGIRDQIDSQPLGQGLTAHIVRTRQALIINRDLEKRMAELGSRWIGSSNIEQDKSFIGIPIQAGDEVIGVVALGSKQEDAFGDADVRLLQTLTNSMGVALENARLFDETQRLLKETDQRAAELGIINGVQEGLASKLEMQAVYDLVGDKIKDVFDSQAVTIAYYDRANSLIHFPYYLHRGSRIPQEPVPYGEGLTSHVIRTRQPLLINEDAEKRYAELNAVFVAGDDNASSWLGVPIGRGEVATGAIFLQNYERENAYTDADVRLLGTIATSMGVALENARLFDETQRLLKETEQRAAELSVINSVQQGLASKLEMQAIYDLVGDKIAEITGSEIVLIQVWDLERGTRHDPYSLEKGERTYVIPEHSFTPLEDIIVEEYRHGRTLVWNQGMEKRIRDLGHTAQVVGALPLSVVGVPLRAGAGNTSRITSISLQNSTRENAFTEADVRLVETLANSMGIALENARLFDETQRLLKETEQRAQELAIINSVQEGLASKLDLQAIYDLVGDKIREVFDAQAVLIAGFDHDTQTDALIYGFENGERIYDDSRRPFPPLVHHLINTRRPVVINENVTAASAEYGMTTVAGTAPPKSMIYVPFGTAAQVNGYFSLQNIDRENAFSESDVRLLQTLAGSMGIAIENARLFNAEQARAAELSAISTVSQALVAETDLDKMIELIGQKLIDIFHPDIAYVALLDRTANQINFPYSYGDDFPPLKYGQGLTSRILESAQPLLLNRDIQKRRQELGTERVGREAASYIGVPILAGGQAIGVVSVQSTTLENAFDEAALRLLGTIAANAGAAIRNAQLHAETQRRAQEMAILAEIGNDIAASRDLEPVLERIAAHAKDILNVRDIAIALRDPDGVAFHALVALGHNTEEIRALRIVPGRGIMGNILQSGIAEFVNQPSRDPRTVHVPGTPEEEDARQCLMGAPLVSRGETIGGIMVWRNHEDGLFSQAELDFLISVARQTAIAIESARLYLETQRRANEMSALAEVGREISSSLEPGVVLEKIAARAKDLLAAGSSAVFLMNPDGKTMRTITVVGDLEEAIKDDIINLGEGIIGNLALEGSAEVVKDTSRDPRAVHIAGTPDLTRESLMAAPLFRGAEVTGMMAVWRTNDPFGEMDLNFLSGLARQASIALENARLFDEIKRQGQYLETIFSNSPVAIVTVDENGKVLSWSPAAEKLFGYGREEALGQDVDDLVANADEVSAEARAYTHQGMDNQYVHRITKRTRRDGTLVDVDLSALPLPLEGGKTGVVAIYNDVGEIQRQRKYYEAIVQNSPVAIVTVDESSRVASWNPGAEQLFGYAMDEAIGRNIDEMVAATDEIRTQAEQYNQQAMRTDLHVITRRTRRDGSLVDVELAGVPLPLPSGKSGLVAIYHDITELQRARQEAIAANEAKSAFLATMSHEIRTPMNAVIGMSGLLMDTQLTREQHDYAETIRNSGDALLAIINDILDFSKIEAGKMDLERQPFDLRECVESALDLVASRAVEKNIDLAYILDDDVPQGVKGDVTRLRQILLNLLSNAVKFTEKGEVVLTVKPDKVRKCLLFTVRDTGIGIPQNRMDRLFASFSQADSSTTRRYGGTGLGLAISKRLAEMMGGNMWAESAGAGKGSTFSFTIVAESAKVPQRKTAREMRGIQPTLQGKRVLIVDDNATNRRILMLQTQKWGMLPQETESPREALKWLKRGDAFDLAILDLQMPEMDGVMLTRELRQLKQTQALPVVLLTSLGRKEVGADDLSFAAYLTKPLKPSALFDALASIFARDLVAPRAEPVKALIDTELARNHPLRILLAEDNAVNQKLALRLLEQMGYRADVASNGLEAVESVERQTYDVILMDVQMPEMDGLDATRAIRQLTLAEQPRIVAMTANAMQGDREMCIAAGMDDYVSKPIRVAELSEALLRTRTTPHQRVAVPRKRKTPSAVRPTQPATRRPPKAASKRATKPVRRTRRS